MSSPIPHALKDATRRERNRQDSCHGPSGWAAQNVQVDYHDTGKRRTSLTYPISQKKFEYSHDALNRITEISLDGGMSSDKPMVRYAYKGTGLGVIQRDGGLDLDASTVNTFQTVYSDDALGRLATITHNRVTTSTTRSARWTTPGVTERLGAFTSAPRTTPRAGLRACSTTTCMTPSGA